MWMRELHSPGLNDLWRRGNLGCPSSVANVYGRKPGPFRTLWFMSFCLLAVSKHREFKCYGSYIFPVLLIFGVLAISIALLVYFSVRHK